jgi:ribosomal protein S12 methylthiotransferase
MPCLGDKARVFWPVFEMKKNPVEHPVRVGLISLGCAKNLVDGELMLGSLLNDGMKITNDAAQADVVIVNTCSFIDAAQEESVDAILQSAQLREASNREQGLIVSGCLPQRFREELPKLLPEVDAFMGIDQVAQAAQIVREALTRRKRRIENGSRKNRRTSKPRIINQFAKLEHPREGTAENPASPLIEVHSRPTYIPDFATPRFRLTPAHFAYLKIAEGCNHPCSFCIIPRMRGSHRSRPQHDVVREARDLLGQGVKELNLISQDSTYYGLDLRQDHRPNLASPEKFRAAAGSLSANSTTLCTLLRELNALPGEFWVRLLYTHPAHWTDDLIRTIADCPKVARYVDMPLQHIHAVMLERMRRETSCEYILDLIARIRAGIPNIALRTTFIVGFPGETEACFQELLDFIRETKFERAGVFAYSQEQGTRAGAMGGQIPEKVKRQRRELAMAAQHEVAQQVSRSFLGRRLKVLIEGEANAKQLDAAQVLSWEHGALREHDSRKLDLGGGKIMIARGEADAPDIDGRVYVQGAVEPGRFADVKVIGHTDYDLIAQPL